MLVCQQHTFECFLYDLQKLGTSEHSYTKPDNMPPATIVMDSEAAMAMANQGLNGHEAKFFDKLPRESMWPDS